jgi:murein DD-endopeptidase MepM/ murein hydrolase activator NlpD
MTGWLTDVAAEDAPVGYPVEGHGPGNPGREPAGTVGIAEHGAVDLDRTTPAILGVIASSVWGGGAVPINTSHGMFASWDPCHRPVNPDHSCCPCCWYRFAADVCMTGCVHPGMDIGVTKHTALFAAQGGRVVFAGWADVYRPHYVQIRTPQGEDHYYAHMWSVDPSVVTGGQVHPGQYLGTSGEQTFRGTMQPDGSGEHLHFEVRRVATGCAEDPTFVLQNAAGRRPCTADAPPPFDGTEKRVNNVVFHPDRRTVEVAIDGLNGRRYASLQSCMTRQPLDLGEKVDVLYWLNGDPVEGESRWWVTTDGTRLWTGGTVEKPLAG